MILGVTCLTLALPLDLHVRLTLHLGVGVTLIPPVTQNFPSWKRGWLVGEIKKNFFYLPPWIIISYKRRYINRFFLVRRLGERKKKFVWSATLDCNLLADKPTLDSKAGPQLKIDQVQCLEYCTWYNWYEWLRFKVTKNNFKSQPLNIKNEKSKKVNKNCEELGWIARWYVFFLGLTLFGRMGFHKFFGPQ